MQRVVQSLDELLGLLSVQSTEWRDDLAVRILENMRSIPNNRPFTKEDLQSLLNKDFEASLTIVRLFLDRSKDEFEYELKTLFYDGHSPSRSGYIKNPNEFIRLLLNTGILAVVNQFVSSPVSWHDLIAERLKGGRGSAIKGQYRGRALEDFVESIVKDVFGDSSYNLRTSFIGKDGKSTAKSDFAIPSKDKPSILIEVKAFGATGSKQTNVIGDAQAIIAQKRHDTNFLVVTDGITWHARKSDLKRLVQLQNAGDIFRIYTRKMKNELQSDLIQMKKEYNI